MKPTFGSYKLFNTLTPATLLHCKIFIIVTKSLYFIKVYIVFYQGIFWFIPKWFGWNQSLGMCKAEPKFWFIPKYVLVLPKFCGINQNDLDKIKMLVCVKMNLNFGSYQNIFWFDPDCVVFYFENNFTACQSHITACQANI